jgi:hypothetical protein
MEATTYVQDDVLIIEGREYQLVTRGRQQARQVAGLTKWASRYGAGVYDELQSQGTSGEEGGIQFLLNIIGMLNDDALIDLFQALSGCTTEEAELYFDAATLIEAGIVVYEKHPTVRKLLDRFFSTSDSEQGEPDESSTTSE